MCLLYGALGVLRMSSLRCGLEKHMCRSFVYVHCSGVYITRLSPPCTVSNTNKFVSCKLTYICIALACSSALIRKTLFAKAVLCLLSAAVLEPGSYLSTSDGSESHEETR